MPGAHLYGWKGTDWQRVLCNEDGELLIDPSAIFEDDPTDGELEKAPTSNWAYDHENDAIIHHVKYTDVDARGAIGDKFDSTGKLTGNLNMDYRDIQNLKQYYMKASALDNTWKGMLAVINSPIIRFRASQSGVGYRDVVLQLYMTDHYVEAIHDDSFQAALALYLEESPTDGVVNKAPTSNWAYDHNADTDKHHTKYTDLEAQQACNLDGDLYWSLPGNAFMSDTPAVDDVRLHPWGYLEVVTGNVSLRAPVALPHGATVTEVVVYGNLGAESQTATLRSFKFSDQTRVYMASSAVNTPDTSITDPVIDNSGYHYYLSCDSLATDDLIYGARIKYTL